LDELAISCGRRRNVVRVDDVPAIAEKQFAVASWISMADVRRPTFAASSNRCLGAVCVAFWNSDCWPGQELARTGRRWVRAD
jgi:hypothetical protein